MKKIITSIIIAMTMVVSSFALDFSIGAKGVLSTNLDPESKVSFKDTYTNLKTNPVFDGGFGVFANFALLGGLGVQAEANFITSNVNFALEENKVVDYESLVMDIHQKKIFSLCSFCKKTLQIYIWIKYIVIITDNIVAPGR